MARTTDTELLDRIRRELAGRPRVLITSHVRPDGDSIGSQVALALALRAKGHQVRIVNCDPPQPFMLAFPGVSEIEIASRAEGEADAVFVLECGSLDRTGVEGLAGRFVVNIDHHRGNTLFGAINWFDETAAACGELVFDLIRHLGVPLTREMAEHLYVAILTDTGSFHHSGISPHTFDICREALEAGVDPVAVARTVYDSNSVGRLRLFGAVMSSMEIHAAGRLAVIRMDREMERTSGGSYEDTEGLINMPLTVKEIQAVAFFKDWGAEGHRVSLRSKGAIDVREVALRFGGGGHRNASGCMVGGALSEARARVLPLVEAAIANAGA